MPDLTKIATCCYCGTRAVLRLDRRRHELTCRACGAGLQHMKPLPKRPKQTARKTITAPPIPRPKPVKHNKTRKRKRWSFDLWDELEDLIEDVFDFD